jgi:hypothetical protein
MWQSSKTFLSKSIITLDKTRFYARPNRPKIRKNCSILATNVPKMAENLPRPNLQSDVPRFFRPKYAPHVQMNSFGSLGKVLAVVALDTIKKYFYCRGSSLLRK